MKYLSIFVILIAFIAFGCYNDSEETLFPQSELNRQHCDTSLFTYSGAVKPMIDGNCISCHTTQAPILDNYANVASSADRILGTIKHLSGFSAMPKYSLKLEDCKITQFEKWIKAGKKND
jgi:hypothetical protein